MVDVVELVKSYGKVLKILYYNNQSKWGVLSVENNTSVVNDTKITLSGIFEGVYENCQIEYEGTVKVHPKYGKQIDITQLRVRRDTSSKESIINFLSKSAIKGIDVQNAVKIYNTFGTDSIDVVLNKTDKLLEIKGIGTGYIEKIKKSVEDYKRIEDLINYCTDLNLPYSIIHKLDVDFGEKALDYVKGDIYNILKLENCSLTFSQVDSIALAKDKTLVKSGSRGSACLVYLIRNMSKINSSTGIPLPDLKNSFFKKTGTFNYVMFTASLSALIKDGTVILERNIVYLKDYYEIEKGIADIVNDMCSRPIIKKLFKKSVVEEEINNFDFELNEQQKSAIKNSLVRPVSVLTGPPGCGKSTVTKALCNIYSRSGFNVVLLAPTGKAVRRLAECTGRNALTIHKFLNILDSSASEDGDVTLIKQKTVVIIDESSMIDILIFSRLLSKVNNDTRIILVGDIDQLPSVQVGNVLSDIVYSRKVNVCKLTDIMRQQENSLIIKNCSLINTGHNILKCDKNDFFYKEYSETDELLDDFLEQYKLEVELNGLDDVQVISPYKKGDLGINVLNREISELINDNPEDKTFNFKVGDKVMQLVNDYSKEVFNGETGVVSSFEGNSMKVEFDGDLKTYYVEDLPTLQLAYAGTVHKMQGSEYPIVFVLLENENPMLMLRKILYTAVSRGKKKVYIYSIEGSVKTCINNTNEEPRITKLKELIAKK